LLIETPLDLWYYRVIHTSTALMCRRPLTRDKYGLLSVFLLLGAIEPL